MFTDRRANSLETRRTKQAWPHDKTFKILSLDGGGIKGIYSAHLLKACENKLCAEQPLAAYFDMIAGTSTGGIIALGLGLGFSLDEIIAFYKDDGRKIFPPSPKTRLGLFRAKVRNAAAPKLRHEELEDALERRFGDMTFGMSSNRLVVPAFMMPETEIAVFKTDHHPDYKHDHKALARQVARATSAAPTYLKGMEHSDSGRIFLDGGIWANNPVMIAIVDAISSYDLSLDRIRIVSIGTGNPPFVLEPKQVLGGFIGWLEAIKAAMFLTTDNATAQAKLLLGPEKVLRFEPTGENALIEMDDYDRAFQILPSLARADLETHYEALQPFFQKPASARERHHTSQ